MGKRALGGLDGVEKVKNGFLHGREVNWVRYDPNRITIEDMVRALEDAGTYRGTVDDDG